MSETDIRVQLHELFPRLRAANEALMRFNAEKKDEALSDDDMIQADLLVVHLESERKIYQDFLRRYIKQHGTSWK